MPSAEPIGSPLPSWKRPTTTKENLDWADFVVLDLSKFDEPNGKQKLANQLRDAVCLIAISQKANHGLTSITGP